MNKNDCFHATHTICMTHEQLRVIAHALAVAKMTGFAPAPQDDIDAEGSSIEMLCALAADTLAENDSNLIHGWAI